MNYFNGQVSIAMLVYQRVEYIYVSIYYGKLNMVIHIYIYMVRYLKGLTNIY